MINDIKVYLRDGVKLEKEKWDELLNIDCEEAKPGKPNGIMDVWEDTSKNTHINYIHDIDDIYDYFHEYNTTLYLNNHYYVIKTTGYSYDCAEDLRDDLLEELTCFNYEYVIIEEILAEMTEEELLTFFSKSKRLHFVDGKITRSYNSNSVYHDEED